MDYSQIIYGIAVAWFTYYIFWMGMHIYQFKTFPGTYGKQAKLSLEDLGKIAVEQTREIPTFRVLIPAYMETDVIEGTINRLVSINYPRTHFEVNILTYEDEPTVVGQLNTTEVVENTLHRINARSGRVLVRSIVVPASFDGYFPGSLHAPRQHTSKARGLNFGLRTIHERNERDERQYLIGRLSATGHLERIERTLRLLKNISQQTEPDNNVASLIEKFLQPNTPGYLGIFPCQYQLVQLIDIINSLSRSNMLETASWGVVAAFIKREAARHFLTISENKQASAPSLSIKIKPVKEKGFLDAIRHEVEQQPIEALKKYYQKRDAELKCSRPLLHHALNGAKDSEELYQQVRRINSRWVMVYDADAEAPLDVMRHLAGRILTEPEVMGYQGPVAPVQNYDDVHAISRMSGLWMAFWHGSSYPRLLQKKSWAHPLAGTNWCFRIEGFEDNDHLIRDCGFDESRRNFLLRFDPQQLTEDLESGIRMFSEWSVNAAWHPVPEIEQVPPTAGGVFRQHTRWSLGTQQTIHYILHSRLPVLQKIWYALTPIRVVLAGLGPIIAIGLLIALYTGVLEVAPVFSWWSVLLVFGNLIFFWAFLTTFHRFFDARQQHQAMDYLYYNRVRILAAITLQSMRRHPGLHARLERDLGLIRDGFKPGGFVNNYMRARYTDLLEPPDTSANATRQYILLLQRETLGMVEPKQFDEFVEQLSRVIDQPAARAIALGRSTTSGNPDHQADLAHTAETALLEKMHSLVINASSKAGVNRFPRWSKYHTQILLWSIPYIYFSLTPFFYAFWCYAMGERKAWDKTSRTVKS